MRSSDVSFTRAYGHSTRAEGYHTRGLCAGEVNFCGRMSSNRWTLFEAWSCSCRLSSQFFEHLLCLLMFRTLFEKFQKRLAGFASRAFHHIYTRKIQVSLIEAGGHPDAFFETRNRFVPAIRAEVKNAKVIECFWIIGANFQSFLQILASALGFIKLRKDHPQAVACFG